MTASPLLTQDGSYTFFSEEFGEAYHSLQGAKSESFDKFATVTQLSTRATTGHVKLLDVCYGLGYNSAAALETIWATHPDCQVELFGLELDSAVLQAALSLDTFGEWSASVQSVLATLAELQGLQRPTLQAEILMGDARQTIQQLKTQGWQADAIFLDPFSPRRCPQLWTVEFLSDVAACLAPDGVLATYSRSAAVRAALIEVGLQIGTIPVSQKDLLASHMWAHGTVASHGGHGLVPLTKMEQEHLLTRAGIPFRDPSRSASPDRILTEQSAAQASSTRESTSSWRRRWKIA